MSYMKGLKITTALCFWASAMFGLIANGNTPQAVLGLAASLGFLIQTLVSL